MPARPTASAAAAPRRGCRVRKPTTRQTTAAIRTEPNQPSCITGSIGVRIQPGRSLIAWKTARSSSGNPVDTPHDEGRDGHDGAADDQHDDVAAPAPVAGCGSARGGPVFLHGKGIPSAAAGKPLARSRSRRLAAMQDIAPTGAEMPPQYDPTEVEPRWTPDVDRARLLPRAGAERQAPVLHRDPAAQRDRAPARGPRARTHDRGHADPPRADAGLRGVLDPGDGPRGHRDAGGGGAAPARAGDRPSRARPRGVRRACLDLEGAVRRRDRRADQADGRLLRLGARAVHHGRGAVARGARGVRRGCTRRG